MDISMNLRACISQRLIKLNNSSGRVPACEVLLNTPLISELIYRGELRTLKEHMSSSKQTGMQTFDQSLFELIQAEKISVEEGLRHADSVNNLRLQLKLENSYDLKKGTEKWAVM
jgi:twitching motility protein PilU